MHIAFVFSGEMLTDKELQVVRGVRRLPGVSRITVAAVRDGTGVAATAERLRANAERAVARQPLQLYGQAELSDVAECFAAAPMTDVMRHTTVADRIVNLSGNAWPRGAGPKQLVVELLYDARHPDGLGLRRAHGAPPRVVEVTCRRDNGPSHIVQRSVLTLMPETPAGDRRNAASRSVALLLRALNLTDAELLAALPEGRVASAVQSPSTAARVVAAVAASVRVASAAVLRRASRQLWREDAWEIWYRTNSSAFFANSDHITPDGFQAYRAGYDRFVADPIPLSHNGLHAVFFEEYPFATRKGVISCAVLQPNGRLGASQCVLECPYHLSYPFVFRDGDRIYMVPESANNRTVDLYECTAFPFEWKFSKTLLSNIVANDATLHHDGERWWMFATVSTEGAYALDELHLFFADSILGEWQPHVSNPVKCDSHSARPAGPLFTKAGRTMRPTQDCSQSYGGAVNICEIEELSLTHFRERIVDRVDPKILPRMTALHTLAATTGIEVVDGHPGRRMRWETGTI